MAKISVRKAHLRDVSLASTISGSGSSDDKSTGLLLLGLLLITCCILWIALPASAQPVAGVYRVSSGTGFIVSNHGYIVTNEHVVSGCKTVTIRGSMKDREAKVVAVNKDIDLALIKADIYPSRIAALRDYGGPARAGDGAMVIGYPLDSGISGKYKVATTKVISVKGPTGEPKWIQFADSAQEGNSGGPLLDMSGNVIGVIVGKSTVMRYNPISARNEVVSNSDIAISLPYLRKFLNQNRVYYRKMSSQINLSRKYIERRAADYIVNIHCKQPSRMQQYQSSKYSTR